MISELCKGVNTKRAALAVLAVFGTLFLTDFLIHGQLLRGMYQETPQMWRPENEMQDYLFYLLKAQVMTALFFVWIFTKGYEGKGVGEGVRFGLLMGLFSAANPVVQYAVSPISFKLMVASSVACILQSIVAGIVAALVYRSRATSR